MTFKRMHGSPHTGPSLRVFFGRVGFHTHSYRAAHSLAVLSWPAMGG
jgi:hypothetical protein